MSNNITTVPMLPDAEGVGADDLFRGTMRDAGIPRRKASFAEWLVEHFAKNHYGKKNDRNGIRFYGKMKITDVLTVGKVFG